MADGLLLTGGMSDIHAGNYGQIYKDHMGGPNHPLNELRDDMDFTLLRAFMAAGKPVFGIGRGLQVVNVVQGGSLYMDLPEDVYKRQDGQTPLRLLGISLTKLTCDEYVQQSLFPDEKKEREKKLDQAVDHIRGKFGSDTICRGAILRSCLLYTSCAVHIEKAAHRQNAEKC